MPEWTIKQKQPHKPGHCTLNEHTTTPTPPPQTTDATCANEIPPAKKLSASSEATPSTPPTTPTPPTPPNPPKPPQTPQPPQPPPNAKHAYALFLCQARSGLLPTRGQAGQGSCVGVAGKLVAALAVGSAIERDDRGVPSWASTLQDTSHNHSSGPPV